MRRFLPLLIAFFTITNTVSAQVVLKPRPDAFPPEPAPLASKSIAMAQTVEEMASWDRYPTYETYVAMMQQWATQYPTLCRLDTIGLSVQNRLILSLELTSAPDSSMPEFFYSSTMHGDEVTGYVLMLRLIDTLLASYGSSPRLTALLDRVHVCINPLANPDGTYHVGNETVQGSVRYNANGIDLNRNFPDPFGTSKPALPQENEAMIDYVSRHQFRLSANLHGGSEVMNYPWDCFTSVQNPHPQSQWWREVGKRFVDSARAVNSALFRDVTYSGIIAGGDWYVIHGGRQDYMNYYHQCLEMTMEVSTVKTLSSSQLPAYWNALATPLIGYIEEIYSLPSGVGIEDVAGTTAIRVSPNPASDEVTLWNTEPNVRLSLHDMTGRRVGDFCPSSTSYRLNLSGLPSGVYILKAPSGDVRIVKM